MSYCEDSGQGAADPGGVYGGQGIGFNGLDLGEETEKAPKGGEAPGHGSWGDAGCAFLLEPGDHV